MFPASFFNRWQPLSTRSFTQSLQSQTARNSHKFPFEHALWRAVVPYSSWESTLNPSLTIFFNTSISSYLAIVLMSNWKRYRRREIPAGFPFEEWECEITVQLWRIALCESFWLPHEPNTNRVGDDSDLAQKCIVSNMQEHTWMEVSVNGEWKSELPHVCL